MMWEALLKDLAISDIVSHTFFSSLIKSYFHFIALKTKQCTRMITDARLSAHNSLFLIKTIQANIHHQHFMTLINELNAEKLCQLILHRRTV